MMLGVGSHRLLGPPNPGWHRLHQLRITKPSSGCGQTEGLGLGKTELGAADQPGMPLPGAQSAWESCSHQSSRARAQLPSAPAQCR